MNKLTIIYLAILFAAISSFGQAKDDSQKDQFPKIASISICYDGKVSDSIGMFLDFAEVKMDDGSLVDDSKFTRLETKLEASKWTGVKPPPIYPNLVEHLLRPVDIETFGRHAWSIEFPLTKDTPLAVFETKSVRAYDKEGHWITINITPPFQAPMCDYKDLGR